MIAMKIRIAGRHDPDWHRELVQRLIPAKKPDNNQDEDPQDPNQKPDEIKFDDKAKNAKRGTVELARQSAEVWMRNIQTSPAQLLRRKFAIEAERKP